MTDIFIHEQALCESDEIGARTRVWAFAHVLAGARIGEDCNICDGVFIENDVIIGDRVTVKCGVQLWNGVVLEDDVFIGPNATFTNDRFPRSRQWLETNLETIVRSGASVGANATILPGLEIGLGAMVGAGAVVTRSVPPHAVVTGNPARITGYAQTSITEAPPIPPATNEPGKIELGVGAVHVQRFAEFSDLRGRLTAGEFPGDAIPFTPQRWFLVYDVPSREIRGEHAHRVCHQFCSVYPAVWPSLSMTAKIEARYCLMTPRSAYIYPRVCGVASTATTPMRCCSCLPPTPTIQTTTSVSTTSFYSKWALPHSNQSILPSMGPKGPESVE